jgi:ribosome-binding protein aMBF1 (putative translation factor)
MLRMPRLELGGRRYVVLEEKEYERICRENGQALEADDLPPYPKPNADGNYPALEYVRVSLARDLIRERRALGLSQQQLAQLANVRQETISRLESGKHTADSRTVDKLWSALEAQQRRHRNKKKGK